VVRNGGKVVTISGDQVTAEREITIEQVLHHPETRLELSRLASDVAAGRVQAIVERAYPLEEGLAALEKAESRHAQGKVILTMAAR
jgi:NADPH:quinone reductase-like Zn-dependent oxidoreductase